MVHLHFLFVQLPLDVHHENIKEGGKCLQLLYALHADQLVDTITFRIGDSISL